MKQRILFLILAAMLTGLSAGFAQSECFIYEDEDKTIITGLTDYGALVAEELVIPSSVTTVRANAFEDTEKATSLVVGNGNPTFAAGVFGTADCPITSLNMGCMMTETNIKALLSNMNADILGEVTIEGFPGTAAEFIAIDWTGTQLKSLVDGASITLAAELVADQTFGEATVKGRFTINKEIISFCTSATFMDDGNNNMLFYVADDLADDGRLHIQRVNYIVAEEGVLIHRVDNSEGYCDLERYNGSISSTDETLYGKNMLKGVTTPTPIEKTDGDKTNYILKDGAFHPTSGGTVKANRAYLQIPTSSANANSLSIDFDDESTGIAEVRSKMEDVRDEVYDLQGRKVVQPTRGLYIMNGKKYFIR